MSTGPDHSQEEFRCMVAGFRELALAWRLLDREVDALLFAAEGFWAAACEGCDHWVLSIDCERRMRRCLQLDHALRTGPANLEAVGDWLRRPNPCIQVGHPPVDVAPLAAMTCDPGALATIRNLVVAEY